jgi:hypothetical protein
MPTYRIFYASGAAPDIVATGVDLLARFKKYLQNRDIEKNSWAEFSEDGDAGATPPATVLDFAKVARIKRMPEPQELAQESPSSAERPV